jgi:hypothetical protein
VNNVLVPNRPRNMIYKLYIIYKGSRLGAIRHSAEVQLAPLCGILRSQRKFANIYVKSKSKLKNITSDQRRIDLRNKRQVKNLKRLSLSVSFIKYVYSSKLKYWSSFCYLNFFCFRYLPRICACTYCTEHGIIYYFLGLSSVTA